MRRTPAVAGLFYPGNERPLRDMVMDMARSDIQPKKALAAVSPHAGFVYSGPVAGALFASIDLPGQFILIGPSHRFSHTLFPLVSKGEWETPMGRIPVDADLAARLMEKSGLLEDDERPHTQEHSLEVQLPFLQYFRPDLTFVPVCVSSQASFEELVELGEALAEAIKESPDEVLIIASTDMSHYVSQDIAREKDFKAIERILDLDAQGLFDTVRKEDISMCGVQPTTAALVASNLLGAQEAELIEYQTSGDVTGDFNEVVGYAGISIR